MKKEIGFIIEDASIKKNSVLVRLYSPDFKNPKDTYPIFNIPLINFDISYDIKNQIAEILSRQYDEIVLSESAPIAEKYKLVESLIGKQILFSFDDKDTDDNKNSKTDEKISVRDLDITPIPLENLNLNFIN